MKDDAVIAALEALEEACAHRGVSYPEARQSLRSESPGEIATLTRMVWDRIWPAVPPSSEEDLRPEVKALLRAHRQALAAQIQEVTGPLEYEDAFHKLRFVCDDLLGFPAKSSALWPQLEKVLELVASSLVSMWSAGPKREGDEEIVRKATDDFQKGKR